MKLPAAGAGSTVNAVDAARTWLPRGLALAAFALYVLSAPPGFYWLDSAELSAAAVRLGVAHPTGFPLYCILARAAALIPLGELAFRIGLLSAGCAALCVFLVARLVCESCREDVHALVGATVAGALLAVSAVLLRQATVAEVYAPTAALLAAALVLLDRVARGADARWGLGLAVVCGLGLATHVTFALIGPLVIAVMAVRLYRGARWPLLALLVVVTITGALVAYLPVRSASGQAGALDWGQPDRVGRLLDHLSARHIRGSFQEEMGAIEGERLGPRIATLARDTADQLGPFTPLAALLGLAWLARQRRSRWLAATLGALAAGDVLYALLINPMGQRDWQNGVPLALAASACAGAAVAWMSRTLGRAGPFVGAVAGLLLVLPAALVSLPAAWPASAPGGARDVPRAWSEAALAATPPRGLALVQYDSTAAGLLYLTEVEGARPDVSVLVRQFLVSETYARAARARSGLDDSAPGAGEPMDWILGAGRPVAWEIGRDTLPPGLDVRIAAPLVVLAQAERASADIAGQRRALAAAARSVAAIFAGPGGHDRIARRVYARMLTALGRLAYGRGALDMSENLFEQALAVRPTHVAALVNRGVVAARRGDFAAAVGWTERALALDPGRVGALINAARYLLQMDDPQRAGALLDRALRIDEGHAGAWALAATVDLRAGRTAQGLERLRRALALDPGDPDARFLVDQLGEAERARLEE